MPFAGIWWKGENEKPARRLHGPAVLLHRQGELTFHLVPTAFFQINPEQTDILLRLVIEAVEELPLSATVTDLFCGAGLFALHLAQANRKVVGYELAGDGLASAGLTQTALPDDHPGREVSFLPADLRAGLPVAAAISDVIVVDPPRSGLSPELVADLIQARWKRLIYVSCNPGTMARDLKILTADPHLGLTSVTPVDCFPNTGHVEGVALIDRLSE